MKSLLLSLLLLLAACDRIEPEHRWSTPQPLDAHKAVLVEDFTGQKCLHCPKAASLIAQMELGANGRNIIAVAIHGGNLSRPAATDPRGLATDAAQALHRRFAPPAFPMGMVDRGNLVGIAHWSAQTAERLAPLPPVRLQTVVAYDAATRLIDLRLDIAAQEAAPDLDLSRARYVLYLVEDSIRGWQYMPDGKENRQYLHRHVLRDVLTPLDGTPLGAPLAAGSLPADAAGRRFFAAATGAKWSFRTAHTLPQGYGKAADYPALHVRPEQVSIVAFVLHPVTGRVLQVVRQSLL